MPSLSDRLLTLFATFHIRREKALVDIAPIYADDVHFIDPLHDVRGKQAFLAVNRALLRHFEEVRFDELEVVGSDPHFMLSWVCNMRPKHGPAITARGVTQIRSQNGLVVEHVDHWDLLSAMAGVVPGAGVLYKRITARLFSGPAAR